MGAPLGNNNAGEGKRYRKAIERALAHKCGSVDDGLFEVAKARVLKALEGDPDAAKEIGDRFDGRPAQAVTQGDDGPWEMILRWASEKS
jgi:hypothetical protein